MTAIPHVFFNGEVPLAAHVHRDGGDRRRRADHIVASVAGRMVHL